MVFLDKQEYVLVAYLEAGASVGLSLTIVGLADDTSAGLLK